MSAEPPLVVDFSRLKSDVETLAKIGRGADHGIYRMAFSEGDMAARAWLHGRIEAAGLECRQDGAANLFGYLPGKKDCPSVMTGSHIDTVPGAGHLDGALGVLCGLEALRVIAERDLPLVRPLELIAFSDEEGRFGGMFGSQALAGELTPEAIHTARDAEGISLVEAMAVHGLDATHALAAARPPESLHAFVELHIEQGPVLDGEGVPIGVVEGITGLRRWEVRLNGVANHAGTTPMAQRVDAFKGLAEFAMRLDGLLAEHGGPSSVATIGHVELVPGAANVIPGEARFTLEFRDTDAQWLDRLAENFARTLSDIGHERGLHLAFDEISTMAPVPCDKGLAGLIEAVARELAYPSRRMVSGAAHDTQKMAAIGAAGMIFVPSRQGRSHSPAEWTAWGDIEAGANVLLNTLYRLAS